MARQHGILTTISGLSGAMVLNNLDWSESVEIAEARDESGKVVERKAYSKTTTVKGDGDLDVSAMPADVIPDEVKSGAKITIAGKSYLINDANVKQVNTDFAKVSFTASRKDDETQAAYEAPAAAAGGGGGGGGGGASA